MLALLMLPFLLKRFSITETLTDGIYLATGLIILWYTIETSVMRREMEATRARIERPEVIRLFAESCG